MERFVEQTGRLFGRSRISPYALFPSPPQMTHTLFLVGLGGTSLAGAVSLSALHYYVNAPKSPRGVRAESLVESVEPVEKDERKTAYVYEEFSADFESADFELPNRRAVDAANALSRALDSVAFERSDELTPFEFCAFDD
jgi:hypothetical protein